MLKKLFHRPKKGYVMILLAVAIPVFLAAVNLGIKRIQKSHRQAIKTSTTFATGQAALAKYNPSKTWNDNSCVDQYKRVYSAAAQALNDRAFDLDKSMALTPSSVQVYYSSNSLSNYSLTKMYTALSSFGLSHNPPSGGKTFFRTYAVDAEHINCSAICSDDVPIGDVVFNTSGSLSFKFYKTSNDTAAYNVVYYNPDAPENANKLTLSLDTTNNCITCDCKCLGKKVKAYPAKCDVDIVLTLPTNHAACTSTNDNTATLIAPNGAIDSTPIVQISKAYQKFLKENFTHTRGVTVGVVPYSAKISVPPNQADWTIAIPPMDKFPDKPYIKQAVAYGTDGQAGGELVSTAIQYDWGNVDGADAGTDVDPNVGFPIMFRKGYRTQGSTGAYPLYREVGINHGVRSSRSPQINLLSTDNPAIAGANSDYAFQRMNLNPCYLGHCNLLAGACERTCPTYMANPYFITELTDDAQNVIYDLSLIRPINDPKNKSNFLFLAVQWAQNLLTHDIAGTGWTAHPTAALTANQKFAHPNRKDKKKAVILIVNAPDRFEPQELTYLGFNNDNSEIPMFESDVIDFSHDYGAPTNDAKTSPVKGGKGILKFMVTSGTGTVSYNATSGRYECPGTGVVRLTFPQKGLVKLVVRASNLDSWATWSGTAGARSSTACWTGICHDGEHLYAMDRTGG